MDKLGFLKSVFGDGKYFSNSKELLVFCPFCCHKNNRLSINLETDNFKCWTCLKSGIGLFYLLKVSKASSQKVAEYEKVFKAKTVNKRQHKEEINYKPQLPDEYKPLIHQTDKRLGKKYLKYLKNRGVSDEQILKYKIGACYDGLFRERIIFPSFNIDGNLNFFNGRSIDISNSLPYLNDRNAPKGYRSTVILNELNLDFTKPLVLVEGWFDLLKSIDNTSPLLGSELSAKSLLVQTIIMNKTPTIFATDPDALQKKILPFMKVLLSFDVPVFDVEIKPYKDIGDMTQKEGIARIENAKPVDRDYIFKKKVENVA